VYDFLLMSENPILLLIFIPFIVFLWIFGFKRMKAHSRASVFKDKKPEEIRIDLEGEAQNPQIEPDVFN
jgi:hypothetical protein